MNEVTERDTYPLPQIHATVDKLRGARYLTTLNLKDGYWQVPLDPYSRPITAFTVPGKGLMQFRVMPFGLHSAPTTFQRLLDMILGSEFEPHVFDSWMISWSAAGRPTIICERCARFIDAYAKPSYG